MILAGFCKEMVFLPHMRQNKSIKIFVNYILGPALFVWLSYTIYRQIVHQPQLEASWLHVKEAFQSVQLFYFIAAVCLIPVNWGLEARKWQLSVAFISPVSFSQAFKAVLSGVSFSVTTPNRVGEYVGRMLYLPDGSRLKSIALTLVGSLSQLLVTFYTGLVGLIFLKPQLLHSGLISAVAYQYILYGVGATALFLTVLYFETGVIGQLLNRWLRHSNYRYLIQAVQAFQMQLLLRLLLLSFLRYTIFVAQYFLLFRFFGVYVPAAVQWNVLSLMFLTMAVIPSISLAEVGLRGEISLTLMGLFTANSLGIGLSTVTIWFLNLVVPALAGSVLILGVNFFYKRNESR